MSKHTIMLFLATGLLASAAQAQELIANGGFETGLFNWNRVDQLGSDGSFALQTGSASPVNGFTVPAPREGLRAAMTDSTGPGSHVLYQDVLIPAFVPGATLKFSIYVGNGAAAFSTPSSLDFSTPALNQQARVDILRGGTDPFSVSSADVLFNAFQTALNSPLVTGYNDFTIDVGSVLAANAGQTLRLRFAEVDNVNFFNFGVDAVSLTIPAPSALGLIGVGMLGMARRRR
ncbi:MAG: PEP-CTERM sorting domain-containing protein [Phycisphaerales bacterium]|nr:PEP-CTERM sorting domain-containing protein [Phycisphaerales bacterium]